MRTNELFAHQHPLAQVDKYAHGELIHSPDAPEGCLLSLFEHDESRDILAYLSIVDD